MNVSVPRVSEAVEVDSHLGEPDSPAFVVELGPDDGVGEVQERVEQRIPGPFLLAVARGACAGRWEGLVAVGVQDLDEWLFR